MVVEHSLFKTPIQAKGQLGPWNLKDAGVEEDVKKALTETPLRQVQLLEDSSLSRDLVEQWATKLRLQDVLQITEFSGDSFATYRKHSKAVASLWPGLSMKGRPKAGSEEIATQYQPSSLIESGRNHLFIGNNDMSLDIPNILKATRKGCKSRPICLNISCFGWFKANRKSQVHKLNQWEYDRVVDALPNGSTLMIPFNEDLNTTPNTTMVSLPDICHDGSFHFNALGLFVYMRLQAKLQRTVDETPLGVQPTLFASKGRDKLCNVPHATFVPDATAPESTTAPRPRSSPPGCHDAASGMRMPNNTATQIPLTADVNVEQVCA